MSKKKNSKNKALNDNLSQNLAEMRNLALTVTHSDKIGLKYDPKQPTSFYNPGTDEITLSLAPYPDFVINHERIAKKCLDGDN